MGSLGASWARSAPVLGASWSVGGRLGGVLRRLGGVLGPSWEDLGEVRRSLGSFPVPFWEHVWKIFCHFEQYAKIAKNLGKPMVFH